MSERHNILLLVFLFPALALGQTIHFEKERVVYKGKIELRDSGISGNYLKAKDMLLNVVDADPDSLVEKRNDKELVGSASLRLPTSEYHIIKTLDYQVKLIAEENAIAYEIGNIKLHMRERGKKAKTLRAEEILKGMEESGRVAKMAEQELNAIDMHLQKIIALMQSYLNTSPASVSR
jgi:hypothetical protein